MIALPDSFAETGLHFVPGAVAPTRFQVIGERSSGTNYLKRLLGRNTPLQPVELLGWKHGHMQALAIPRDMVVLISLRDARPWALSMFAKPWHTKPDHQALPFDQFLRAPWDTVIDHAKYFPGTGPLMLGEPLQQDRDPLTGLPYGNLLRLRTGKLRSHLSFVQRGCACVVVRQQTVLTDPQGFLAQFRAAMGLPVSENALRPVVKRLGARFNAAVNRPSVPSSFPSEQLSFLRQELDLPMESALGYCYD